MDNTKICSKCGKLFEKKINCSRKKWMTIKCCSISCSKRGNIPWNKGIPMSEERKLYYHNLFLGKTFNTGRTHIKKGQHLSPSTELKKGLIPWSKGKKNPYVTGSNNKQWKGGITPAHMKIRNSTEMREFVLKILKRDRFTCKFCGRYRKVGDRVVLNVHHIKPFALFPELRFDENNCITLCVECHYKVHSKNTI